MIAWLAMTVSFLVSFGSKMYWLLARDKPGGAFFPFRKQDWLGRQSYHLIGGGWLALIKLTTLEHLHEFTNKATTIMRS